MLTCFYQWAKPNWEQTNIERKLSTLIDKGQKSSVFWIRIQNHVDPYWNGSPGSGSVLRIRIRIGVQKGKNSWISSWKEHWPFNESLMVFIWAWEHFLKVFVAICEEKRLKNVLIFSKYHFGNENLGLKSGSRTWIRIRFDLKSWILIRIEINTDPKHWRKTADNWNKY